MDTKPDKQLSVPTSLNDLSLLLDNRQRFNEGYPAFGQISCDDYYLLNDVFNALSQAEQRNYYLWLPDNTNLGDWSRPYQAIYYTNVVLDLLPQIPVATHETLLRDRVEGSALFYRAFALYELAQAYTPAYEPGKALNLPGLPLRLDPDFNKPSVRASLEATYAQIISDLSKAVNLLPPRAEFYLRPTRAAAWGMLARVYLTMQNYPQAVNCADSCLQLQSTLVNFNSLPVTASSPMPEPSANPEVLFFSTLSLSSIFNASRSRVDSFLYRSYKMMDLRKKAFFIQNADNSYSFKGSYQKRTTYSIFNGITTAEMYLVRAEGLARQGAITGAIGSLDSLLIQRIQTGSFVPTTVTSATEALDKILIERRKELCFRGLRWTDLKRLNTTLEHQTVLTRIINGETYQLMPGSPDYVALIPEKVIQLSGIPQNER
ncbi:membrane protein [Chitinophaga cymbidii]|uniref:Membrane protein n=1 Tax=Chitinophaga cymbidii TaxID=1096750 RepID=A0A512RPU3_9BACT|nr:membrane protein [Chitinophaga cymbidii]